MNLKWKPRDEWPFFQHELEIIQRTLDSWLYTPYKLFSQAPGPEGATDCVRFVGGVGDTVLGTKTHIPRVLSDISFHDPEKARDCMRFLVREFEMRLLPQGSELQPMDVIMCGPRGGGPGHAMFAGTDGYLYHCVETSGVVRTGLSLQGQEYHGTLRRKGGWF